MSDSEWISSEDIIRLSAFEPEEVVVSTGPEFPILKEAVEQLEASLIEKAYERYGNVRDAAKVLGIDSSTFVRKRQRIHQHQNREE